MDRKFREHSSLLKCVLIHAEDILNIFCKYIDPIILSLKMSDQFSSINDKLPVLYAGKLTSSIKP